MVSASRKGGGIKTGERGWGTFTNEHIAKGV